MITNPQAGTNVHEIAPGIYRINTPVERPCPDGFSFNQYLVVDDEPLLFHTGPRRMFPLVREAIARGAAGRAAALRRRSRTSRPTSAARSTSSSRPRPRAEPLCSQVAAMVSVNDLADRPPRALADGETLALGTHARALARRAAPAARLGVRLPDRGRRRARSSAATSSRRAAPSTPPLTEADILGPSEAFRAADGLLRARAGHAARSSSGSPRRAPTHARLHARQRLARRRPPLLRALADALAPVPVS